MIAFISSLGLLLFACIVNYLGAKISGGIQQILSYSLVGLLFVSACMALWFGDRNIGVGVSHVEDWMGATPVLGMVFFAYTGWEMLSFTTEEYKNPKRDFPIAVAVSFVTIIFLYVIIALAIQFTLSPDDPGLSTAPIATLLHSVLGEKSGKFVAIVGVVIIATNLIGASWAASRLMFSSSREGLLPHFLSRINNKNKSPQVALIAVTSIFSLVVTLCFTEVFSLKTLLQVAGQNFFLLYGLSVISYLKLQKRLLLKLFGFLTLGIVILTTGTFGWWILYPIILMLAGGILMYSRGKKKLNIHNQKQVS